jgi:hypothetical protein
MKTTKTPALNQAITTTAALYRATEGRAEAYVKKGNSVAPINLPRG